MTVLTNGNEYGIKDNLFFSFPFVTDSDGNTSIVTGIDLNDEFSQSKLRETIKELEEERDVLDKFL